MTTKEDIQRFFRDFEKTLDENDTAKTAEFYAETFSFGTDQGVQAIKLSDFIRVIPKRSGFFKMIGLKKTTLVSVESESIDNYYCLARVTWNFHYEKEGMEPRDDTGKASYIIFNQNGNLKIVMQIDHQDLLKRAQELGLTPAA